MNKKFDEIVDRLTSLDSLCTTYTHDFGLLPEDEKEKIRDMFRQIHEHHVLFIKELYLKEKEKNAELIKLLIT